MNYRLRNVVLSVGAVALLAGGLAACGNDDDGNGNDSEGMVATFRVGDDEYRILLTAREDIELAEQWLDGEAGPFIPNGLVVRGEAGVNEGWSWHIDPDDLEFAEMTMEVCDGTPSDVEDEIITSDRFCPWSAELVSLD